MFYNLLKLLDEKFNFATATAKQKEDEEIDNTNNIKE